MTERKNVERTLILKQLQPGHYECGDTLLLSPHFDCDEIMVTIVPRESEVARKRRLKVQALANQFSKVGWIGYKLEDIRRVLDELETIDRGDP